MRLLTRLYGTYIGTTTIIIQWSRKQSRLRLVGGGGGGGRSPIQVVGVALIIDHNIPLHKGHIIVIKNFGKDLYKERLIHNENCKIAYVKLKDYALIS